MIDLGTTLLTVAQLSRLINVRQSTLYSWAQRGQIPVQYVGRALRFSPDEITAWLNQQRRPTEYDISRILDRSGP